MDLRTEGGGVIDPVLKILKKPVRLLRRSLRGAPETKSLEFPQELWEREYESGKWDYLESLPEFAHYAVMAGYSKMFGGRDAKILEVGCGTGILYDYLSDVGFSRYKGIDLSSAAIGRAKGRIEANGGNGATSSFEAADGRTYSDAHTYDLVIFNEVLHYFDDCIPVLDRYSGTLNEDGTILISMFEGPTSDRHWKAIEAAHFSIIDSVRLTNGQDLTWNCRAVRPVDAGVGAELISRRRG